MAGLVYSYMRFSDPRQASGHSSERQNAYAARWAEENGLQLNTSLTMRDEGLSAYHQRHIKSGALGAFLAAIEDGKVPEGSVLVVEGLDRLSRAEPMVAQGQLASIVNAGITVVTASDGQQYSRASLKADPMKLIYSLLVMIRAHEESDTKSKRVTASIVKLCKGWQDGTYRGKVRNGKDPQWLRETDDGFEPVPERLEALRLAIRMYVGGHSGTSIMRTLAKHKLSPMAGDEMVASHWYKIIKNPALIGVKRISAGGEDFELQGYYPAVVDEDTWVEIQAVAGGRVKHAGASLLPHVITGQGITYCGYCGCAMSGQNLWGKRKSAESRLQPGYRRLLCGGRQYGNPCPHPSSRSVQPVERAIVNYCSDLMNLRSLYGGDDQAAPLRASLTSRRARLVEIDEQNERLVAVMLAGVGSSPAILAKTARELDTERATVVREISHLETQIGFMARRNVEGIDEKWRAVAAAAIESLDADARMQARKLVGDTFSRITIYMSGVRPRKNARHIDVVLVARGGASRALRIDLEGNWQLCDDLVAPPV